MTSNPLPNYLLAHRKRSALSQQEVAFLLGLGSGEQVSRYERFDRQPSLGTALAFEAVFRKPARELFGGLYGQIETGVANRAKTLAKQAGHLKTKAQILQRAKVLATLSRIDSGSLTQPS